MNIVHFIGNGFDLNLDLETSYMDFYKYYVEIKSDNREVEIFKTEIKSYLNEKSILINWSNLEIALGEYTTNLKTIDEFENIRQDIILNLSKYLKSIEDSFDYTKVNSHKLALYLSAPHIELRNGDKIIFEGLLNSSRNDTANVDIVSFNYTSILDHLIKDFVDKKYSFNNALNKYSVIRNVKHIHGSLDERMIIGVNDNNQVSNKNFIEDLDFTEAFVKTEYNRASNHLVDRECIDLINNANIICIFGSSLGQTDAFWWQLIGQKLLTENCKLIVYHKCFNIKNNLFDNLIPREIRKIKTKFISLCPNLSDDQKKKIEQNIHVNVNSNFFNIKDQTKINIHQNDSLLEQKKESNKK